MGSSNGVKILMVQKNQRGAWVVYGSEGVKQFYGYSKKEAIERYKASGRTVTAQTGGKP